MFPCNRLFRSLFGSRLITCLLALFLFSTHALSLFNLLSLVFQLALFRLPGVFLTCLVVLFRSTPFFYLLGNQCPFFCKLTYK